ncbi:hypothetical protein Pth03_61290 [Planotetraspora thailandica]|uniref:Uncharacterized protein n=1 Tax=Planotetraspora thailandica TaxID=487172 RepID=A0A8J3XYQ5_9ACTN|nr:hypothetical protein [Planotetraspora thailandica]GII57740.1 hypothetical protein Pth03_61290 [Planotetraspora thailandica]
MAPTPLPTATVTTTATVTVTSTPRPAPADSPSLLDQLQGWGTLAAIFVTLGTVWWTNRKSAKDQAAQFAELRARERREVLVEQLQRVAESYAERVGQPDEIPPRFGGLIPAEAPVSAQRADARTRTRIAQAKLQAHVAALPCTYGSLLKMIEFSSVPQLLTETAEAEAKRRLAILGAEAEKVEPHMIYAELAENIAEAIGEGEAKP